MKINSKNVKLKSSSIQKIEYSILLFLQNGEKAYLIDKNIPFYNSQSFTAQTILTSILIDTFEVIAFLGSYCCYFSLLNKLLRIFLKRADGKLKENFYLEINLVIRKASYYLSSETLIMPHQKLKLYFLVNNHLYLNIYLFIA